jgi:hypothetical protein
VEYKANKMPKRKQLIVKKRLKILTLLLFLLLFLLKSLQIRL